MLLAALWTGAGGGAVVMAAPVRRVVLFGLAAILVTIAKRTAPNWRNIRFDRIWAMCPGCGAVSVRDWLGIEEGEWVMMEYCEVW